MVRGITKLPHSVMLNSALKARKQAVSPLLQAATKAYSSKASKVSSDPIVVTLPDNTFQTYELEAPSLEVSISPKDILEMYREMNTVRRLEMAADAMYKAKEIRGFCHLTLGQEAVAVGIEKAINEEDSVITSYRCHSFEYTRGQTVEKILAELMGRTTGVSRGKGGSMHMYTKNFFGGNGIVGAQVPLGLGLAYAHKYNNKPNVSFSLYGDGAANQGQVFEAFNMAKLWKVPAVFCCENNKYGMGTAASRASALTEYYKRGQYIPGLKVNAMDAIAVYQASRFAKEYALEHGPIVLEYETYRYGGHSMSDPGTTYRTREEIQKVRNQRDPVNMLRARILDLEIATEAELKAIEKSARDFVAAEAEKAKAAPAPPATTEYLFSDIYIKGTEPKTVRGRTADEIYTYAN